MHLEPLLRIRRAFDVDLQSHRPASARRSELGLHKVPRRARLKIEARTRKLLARWQRPHAQRDARGARIRGYPAKAREAHVGVGRFKLLRECFAAGAAGEARGLP